MLYYGYTRLASWWQSFRRPGLYCVNPQRIEEDFFYAVMDDFGDLVRV